MPVTNGNNAFGRVSTYASNWMVDKKRVSGGDTNGGAGVGGGRGGDGSDGNDKSSASTVREYSQAASVHGLKYVWAGDRPMYSRIVWGLFFLGMFSALSAIIIIHVMEMSTFPTLTKQTVVMDAEVFFPAVTICNLNQFRKSYIQNNTLLRQILLETSESSNLFEPINFSDPIWQNRNTESSQEIGDSVLEYAPHPLNETLILCQWRHEVRPCSELFKTVVTDFGVCYSFNTYETEMEQRKSDLFGNLYGLSVILYTNQPEYVLSQWNMASGFRALLHGFWETPQMIEKGFSLGPGSSYFGKLSRQTMTFLPAPFKAFGDKECIECDEGQMNGYLRYFPVYDRSACFLECHMNFTSNACGCKGMYDLMINMSLCSPQAYLECYLPSSREFRENNTLRNSCKCPMSCKIDSYSVSLSSASYPSQVFMKQYNSILDEESRVEEKVYRTNYLELHLYYDNSQTVNIEQFPQYTFESIMSSLGGKMGIFLGASIISLVEFIEFIVWTIASRITVSRDRVTKLSPVLVKEAP